jgi:hypothetical protein
VSRKPKTDSRGNVVPFNLERFVVRPTETKAEAKPKKEAKHQRRKAEEPYARVTARWQIAADKVNANLVAIALRYIQSMEQARGNHGAFRVSNARMAEWGVTKWRKMRALHRMARAGLVLLDETDQQNPWVAIVEVKK